MSEFTARIRWQCSADPCVELETRHSGFATAEEAALFANGLSEDGALELQLLAGRLLLTRADATVVEIAADAVLVWELPDNGEDFQVADDFEFQVVTNTFAQLSARGLDGDFQAVKFGVLNAAQEVVDVAVDVDETGLPTVAVRESTVDDAQPASFSLGIMVRS